MWRPLLRKFYYVLLPRNTNSTCLELLATKVYIYKEISVNVQFAQLGKYIGIF